MSESCRGDRQDAVELLFYRAVKKIRLQCNQQTLFSQNSCLFCPSPVILCCEPAQPGGEVTFSINRPLQKAHSEQRGAHSLRIDWNPARTGSLYSKATPGPVRA